MGRSLWQGWWDKTGVGAGIAGVVMGFFLPLKIAPCVRLSA